MRFSVGVCSVCEYVRLTYGQQHHGGVRYCQECFKFNLAWVQLGDDGRSGMTDAFTEVAQRPAVKKALADTATFPDDLAKSIAYGESLRRLVESELDR